MKKKSILLVEDNPHEEMLTTLLLEQHGIFTEVMVARDGEEALDLLPGGEQTNNTEVELPAVVLLDLNLPKIHGLEVLRRLRAHPLTKVLPVVIFTSSIEERDVAAAYQLGANSYIQKAIDFDEFSESIRRVSEYWGVLNTFLPA
ncbi:MAG: response regulator [Thermodesulfobacteriota bacterium]